MSRINAYERVLEALEARGAKMRRTGGGVVAQCPAHDDGNPSLSVTHRPGSPGRALLYCHAGCQTVDVLGALGLTMADTFDDARSPITYRYDSGREVVRTYTDSDGRKTIHQRNLSAPAELWRLALVREAVAAGADVWIAEGEEDALTLDALAGGLPIAATTAPMGASNWAQVDYSVLVGTPVVIVADNDAAGVARALALVGHLERIGVLVRGVVTAHETHNDVTDALAAWTGDGPMTLDDLRNETFAGYRARVGVASDPDDSLLTATDDSDEAVIEAMTRELRLREAARERVKGERSASIAVSAPVRLDDFLREADEPVEYRVHGLFPSGGNIVLAAQYKAGKSTLTGNLARALADGGDFLGRFATVLADDVVIIDNELAPTMMRRWMRAYDIQHPERIRVVSLRGRVGSFDILDPVVRAEWARVLAGASVMLFDCLRPVLDALGLDENRDAGRFLVALDALKAEAGISEAVVVHHMGHGAERSRGDSRILDWPDATWNIVRASDDPTSPRFFKALGRDVEVPEGALTFDADTRTLTYGEGSRQEGRKAVATLTATEAIVAYVNKNPGSTGEQIREGIRQAGRFNSSILTEARQIAVNDGRLRVEKRKGRGGGCLYFSGSSLNSAGSSLSDVQKSATPAIGAGLDFKELRQGSPLADVEVIR